MVLSRTSLDLYWSDIVRSARFSAHFSFQCPTTLCNVHLPSLPLALALLLVKYRNEMLEVKARPMLRDIVTVKRATQDLI